MLAILRTVRVTCECAEALFEEITSPMQVGLGWLVGLPLRQPSASVCAAHAKSTSRSSSALRFKSANGDSGPIICAPSHHLRTRGQWEGALRHFGWPACPRGLLCAPERNDYVAARIVFDIASPRIHERAPLLQRIAAPVRLLASVADRVRQCRLINLARETRCGRRHSHEKSF